LPYPSLTGDINRQNSHWNNVKWRLPRILPTSRQELSQVPSKSFIKSCVATPTQRINSLTSCATSYALQTNPITQPWICHMHTAVSHSSYTLYCALRFSPAKIVQSSWGLATQPHRKKSSAASNHDPKRIIVNFSRTTLMHFCFQKYTHKCHSNQWGRTPQTPFPLQQVDAI